MRLLFSRSSSPTPTGAAREEVCPPMARRGPWWREWRDWLVVGGPTGPRRPEPFGQLSPVKDEFAEMLDDLHDDAATRLYERIRAARSMRELWHLRADVHALVARHFDQVTADERLQALNRHFPRRNSSTAGRSSGFGPLGHSRGDMWP